MHSGEISSVVDGARARCAAATPWTCRDAWCTQLWNPAEEEARATWITSPAGRTRESFEAIDALHREGRVGSGGMPGPLAFAVLLNEYDDVFQLAVGPRPLLRAVFAGLAPLGRLRGYSAHVRV